MSHQNVPGRVRLGIIGFGAQGSMYAEFIADGLVPNMAIGAIADTDADRREQATASRCTTTTSRCCQLVRSTR